MTPLIRHAASASADTIYGNKALQEQRSTCGSYCESRPHVTHGVPLPLASSQLASQSCHISVRLQCAVQDRLSAPASISQNEDPYGAAPKFHIREHRNHWWFFSWFRPRKLKKSAGVEVAYAGLWAQVKLVAAILQKAGSSLPRASLRFAPTFLSVFNCLMNFQILMQHCGL